MVYPYSFVMVRRFRRYHRRSSGYSVEHTIVRPPIAGSLWVDVPASDETETASQQFSVPIIPPTQTEGRRKVKHLTLSFSSNFTGPLVYAIVFVPQGYEPQALHIPSPQYALNMYDANQYVMSSGILDFEAGPMRIRSSISRNLDSGDTIYLMLAKVSDNVPNMFCEITYAIKYD